jgi:hypothetical protein
MKTMNDKKPLIERLQSGSDTYHYLSLPLLTLCNWRGVNIKSPLNVDSFFTPYILAC